MDVCQCEFPVKSGTGPQSGEICANCGGLI